MSIDRGPAHHEDLEYEIVASKDMGGSVANYLEQYEGEEYECRGCHYESYVRTLVAYPHDNGLADRDGNRWWLYVECPRCGHGISYGKLKNDLVDAPDHTPGPE